MPVYFQWAQPSKRRIWTTDFYKILQWSNVVYDSSDIHTREFTYNFAWKTIAWIRTDWWVTKSADKYVILDSTWLKMPSIWQWDANKVKIYYPYDFSSAKQITVQCETYWQATTWWNWFNLWVYASSDFSRYCYVSWWTTTASWYIWRTAAWAVSWGVNYWDTPVTWTYTLTGVFDLDAWTLTFTKAWLNDLTYSLTSSDIASIKSWDCIWIYWWHDIWTLYIKNIYIKVIY